jgi:UDP-N-acetylmuramyl pentapeptide phosphotransferase/UDP-N-acetylglucosamine-1-phosphate transferase
MVMTTSDVRNVITPFVSHVHWGRNLLLEQNRSMIETIMMIGFVSGVNTMWVMRKRQGKRQKRRQNPRGSLVHDHYMRYSLDSVVRTVLIDFLVANYNNVLV